MEYTDLYTELFETPVADDERMDYDNPTGAQMDRDTEREAIALAQYGDQDATLRLLRAYSPLLRRQAALHSARLGTDEARAQAVLGLIEAVHSFDLEGFDGQLAGLAPKVVSRVMNDAEPDWQEVPVAPRTKRRYLDILKRADYDAELAADMAPQFDMSRSTFLSIREALDVRHIGDGQVLLGQRAVPLWQDPEDDRYGDVDDLMLANAALGAVDGFPRDVVEHYYGFVTGDPMSDAEIVQALSERDLGDERAAAGESVTNRSKVERNRRQALGTMRDRLGVIA